MPLVQALALSSAFLQGCLEGRCERCYNCTKQNLARLGWRKRAA